MTNSVRELLGDALYDVFCNSRSNFMCIYNTMKDSIIEINPAMRSHAQGDHVDIETVLSCDHERYIKLNGIPCKLTTLCTIREGVALMKMSVAHTKKWTQTSDLVSLTDITSDGVWEWFPELNFEYMSERFWNILGYEQKDMDENPMSWMEFLNPEDKVKVMKMSDDHVSTRGRVPYFARARYTHKEGKEVIVLCRGCVVDWMPNGKPWRLLGTHTDVTDLVKKDAVEAKTKFISRMSHEIRSPICTILNECELLGNSRNTGVIQDTCKHLISLTDDVLNIDNIKSDGVNLHIERHSLEDVLSKCTKRHRAEARKRGAKIRTTVDEVPDLVMMDLQKFNQVLDNLIGNSLKYSPNGGTITLDVEYDFTTSTCSIRVTDEGVGMDPSFHTSAFEELVQGDSTMIGAGIGLTLCRILSEAMDGNVLIERSAPGEGTTMLFKAHLPQCEMDQEVPEISQGFKVLIVDDIETNRIILRRRIKNMTTAGLYVTDVKEAKDGQEAVDTFRENVGDFQLILMDCHMPILDGFDATIQIHKICASLNLEPIPVVAVTASVSSDIEKRCLSSGMKYVITKPYSEIDLLASIQSCLNSFRSRLN